MFLAGNVSAEMPAEAVAAATPNSPSLLAASPKEAAPLPAPRSKKSSKAKLQTDDILLPDMMPTEASADGVLPNAELLNLVSHKRKARRLTGVSSREGIDVSHYQHIIDWKLVADDGTISYAYIKCSEGSTIKDDFYVTNVEGARRAGISVGAYHFYRPGTPPKEQMRNMKEIAKSSDFDLVPMIDVETRGYDSQEKFIADLKEFARLVSEYYDCKPLFYTGQNFYNKYLIGEFKNYHWMIARYHEEEPTLNDGQSYAFWQFSSKGRVSGIKGNVDRSCLMEGFTLGDVEY